MFLENDKSLRDNLIDYLEDIYEVFDANKSTTDTLEQAYLIVLGQKIVIISEHINSLLDSSKGDIIVRNDNYITSVNTVLQGIIQD